MRQITPLVAVVAMALIAAILGRGESSSLAQQDEIPPPTPMLPPPSAASFQYQGVASCASVACHHGNGPGGTKGSEYTTWIAQRDPHSCAYTVLFDQRSLLIEKNLKGLPDLKQAKPHKDVLCLKCHVNPDVKTVEHDERFHERFSNADGVGCESCHGASERWLSVHYTDPWRGLTADQKKRAGMVNTKDIVSRAEVCVRCHVGWQEADVNHDLIAAGHPRLRFEYGAYLANYPAKHWKVSDDHARYGDFEARAWLIGQAASAKAALELLEYRADPKNSKPWPEFAEFGCFSCHHELQDQEWRRKRNAGQMAWGTWYFAQREIVAGVVSPARPSESEPFKNLGGMMAKMAPAQRGEIIAESARARSVLGRWMSDLSAQKNWDEKSLQRLLATLTKESKSEETDWDRAAQRYLGIAAVFNALSDIDDKYGQDRELKDHLHRLANLLSKDFFKVRDMSYDSPGNFDPDKMRQSLKNLREQLQRRGVE